MRRLFFIAWNFPPLGGAGVQRSLKFARYLPTEGFEPLILTGSGAAHGRWMPPDETLCAEIPQQVRVFRSNENASGESRINDLIARGSKLIRNTAPELIFVSMSPFGDAAVASELSSRFNIPWVADLRDPWALDEFQVYRTALHRWRERKRMEQALSTASLIVMNTPEAAKQCRSAFRSLAHVPIVSVTNGYDAEDFAGSVPTCGGDKFTIVHAGALHTEAGLRQKRRALEYKLLGRMKPGVKILPRSHYYLLQALSEIRRTRPEIAERISVKMIGMPTADDQKVVRDSPAGDLVTFLGYLSHAESVQMTRTADLLFLPMHKMPAGRRATIVPGKTYEYIASGRPVLAAVPDGDARDFLRAAGQELICEPDDWRMLARFILRQFERWQQQNVLSITREESTQFERRCLTRQLAEHLNGVRGPR